MADAAFLALTFCHLAEAFLLNVTGYVMCNVIPKEVIFCQMVPSNKTMPLNWTHKHLKLVTWHAWVNVRCPSGAVMLNSRTQWAAINHSIYYTLEAINCSSNRCISSQHCVTYMHTMVKYMHHHDHWPHIIIHYHPYGESRDYMMFPIFT